MWQRVGEHISGSNVSLVGKPTHPDWSGVIVLEMQTTAVSSMWVWENTAGVTVLLVLPDAFAVSQASASPICCVIRSLFGEKTGETGGVSVRLRVSSHVSTLELSTARSTPPPKRFAVICDVNS
jgi:hypothetical protein